MKIKSNQIQPEQTQRRINSRAVTSDVYEARLWFTAAQLAAITCKSLFMAVEFQRPILTY